MLSHARTDQGKNIGEFALHFYSPRAYNYVRDYFNKGLPHCRTISKWYTHMNAEPGFKEEAIESYRKNNIVLSSHPLYFGLIYDEMAIRQQLEFNGKSFRGYTDMGLGLESDDSLPQAKEALVFLVLCKNGNFKVSVGYFFTDRLSAREK